MIVIITIIPKELMVMVTIIITIILNKDFNRLTLHNRFHIRHSITRRSELYVFYSSGRRTW